VWIGARNAVVTSRSLNDRIRKGAEYEGRSQAEIGEILGCTAEAVETRNYRARRLLRVSLGRLLETV